MRSRGLVISLLGLVAAGPATSTSAPTTQTVAEATLIKIRAEAAEKAEGYDALPSIGQHKLSDVLALDFNGLALVAKTALTPMQRPRSLTLEGLPGICSVWLRLNRAGILTTFKFERLDRSDVAAPLQLTDMFWSPGRVNLSYTRETAKESMLVQLVDDRTVVDPAGPHPQGECRLNVDVTDAVDEGKVLQKLKFVEDDLPTIIARHRTVADLYVRPMLRQLGQERLMVPDPYVARQVLAVRGASDEAIALEVNRLLPQLDSDNFKDRQAATGALKKLGLDGARAMRGIDRSKLSTEQHNRLDELIDANRPVSPTEIEALGADVAFLIDCLELEDREAVRAAAAKLAKVVGGKVEVDQRAPLGERRSEADALRARYLAEPATR